MERFQTQIQDESVIRGLHGTEVAHELGGTFGDESALFSEFFRIGDSVIALIRCAESRIFVCMGHPVEDTVVHNSSA